MLTGLFEPIHLIVILLIVMLLFGAKKLPEIGSGMGKAISNFKRSLKDSPETQDHEDKLESKK
ncbi:MAG: twin-arginine translocase TatA/TatE family subunit [Nitrospirae bacterium]|nr:twin-arginine translocase TatA/TatE family subunit [Nitrospirota bacterium]